jgi:hypothetical protein
MEDLFATSKVFQMARGALSSKEDTFIGIMGRQCGMCHPYLRMLTS